MCTAFEITSFPTSSRPLAAKACHNFSDLVKVHSSCYIDTEGAAIDVDVSHCDFNLVVSPHYWLIRYGKGTIFVVNYVRYQVIKNYFKRLSYFWL